MSTPASASEQRFFDTIADREVVRPAIRSIIYSEDGERVLVQRPRDIKPGTNYAFIGGEYEPGDTFESRLRREIDEETNAIVVDWAYLFVVENLFVAGDKRIHALEHYVSAKIDREDVESRESHLLQEWVAVRDLPNVQLRPFAVRDLLGSPSELAATRCLTVNGWVTPPGVTSARRTSESSPDTV